MEDLSFMGEREGDRPLDRGLRSGNREATRRRELRVEAERAARELPGEAAVAEKRHRRREPDAARADEDSPETWLERQRGQFHRWLRVLPRAEPLPAAYGVIEDPRQGRYGICCSGGGIRSAAFNLGALQVFQAPDRGRVLQRAAYLAAVSGGSYMAAGFATVNKTGHADEDSEAGLIDDEHPPFYPGSPEEHYLRNHSSYMAPGLGGRLALVGQVLRGVSVNLLFLASGLLILGIALGLGYGVMHDGLLRVDGDASTEHWKWFPLGALGAALLLGLAAALVSRNQTNLIRILLGWAGRMVVASAILGALLVALPELLEWLRETDSGDGETRVAKDGAAAAGLGGAATVVATALLQLRARLAGSRLLRDVTDPDAQGAAGFIRTRIWPRLRTALTMGAAAAAGPLLCGAFLVAAILYALIYRDTGELLLPLGIAGVLMALFLSIGDVTSWSLHPFYKARLKTAFALRRFTRRDETTETDVIVAAPRPAESELRLTDTSIDADPRPEWPVLLVCAAANVSDPGATPPGRAVTSFTFSPQTIGGPLIGGVATPEYLEAIGPRGRDVTLPAAVAVSGAALAPSMGKMTRWPLRFLLTLANVRLGVWLPNPQRIKDLEKARTAGKSEPPHRLARLWRWLWERSEPLRWIPGPGLLLRELLGRNTLDHRFLYVTDGGHYENLGLVELLRRGCRDVYCFDASGGRDTQELGDAIALARSELQVEIEIETDELIPDKESGYAARCCKIGTIRYRGGPEGKLIYVRSVLTEDAPQDVRSYHELDPEFPHNSTGQQLYTDQRFEAYRALGAVAAQKALAEFCPPLSSGAPPVGGADEEQEDPSRGYADVDVQMGPKFDRQLQSSSSETPAPKSSE